MEPHGEEWTPAGFCNVWDFDSLVVRDGKCEWGFEGLFGDD